MAARLEAVQRPLRRARRSVRWLGRAITDVLLALLLAWSVLAIWFSNLPWPGARLALAAGFAALGVWALWLARSRRSLLIFAAAFAVVAVWWSSIRPSHDRVWRADVAVMPRAFVDGDRVRITNVRDFEYRSVQDFTPRYREREVSLSQLTGVDFYISYWMPGPIGHTFLSFDFADADPVSISIEARPESDEGYAPVSSMFKQFELIYVVADERDVVGVRTNHRGEDVHLYRIRASPERARRLFLVYLERINELADRPEFYHLLSNNCTLNIVRYANVAGGTPRSFDIRHYLNGLIDGYLYATGRLDTSLPLDELRRRSRINEEAQAAGDSEEFPRLIRAAP
jgi:hypothetical protein